MSNDRESIIWQARRHKADRLATLFIKEVREACFRVDMKDGSKPRSHNECAASIIIVANSAPPFVWRKLAEQYSIDPPSATVVEMTRREVVARCQALINPGDKRNVARSN